MPDLTAQHGGTDAGPEPRFDFSTNANPLGPCPPVLAAARGADFARYPDPEYTRLRAVLAEHHGTQPDRIVVGAGASELIVRAIRRWRGAVHVLGPTFSEYARGARLARRTVCECGTPEDFLAARRARRGLGFICWPNNPTGTRWPPGLVAAAKELGPLIVDLAYAPLCAPGDLRAIEEAAAGAMRLYAPNKAFGLTGLRAAYLVLPRADERLVHEAPAWVIDRPGEAFLAATVEAEAQRWLADTRERYAAWRDALAVELETRGFEVRPSPATYLMARVGGARELAAALRARSVRVRDCSSFGLPDWIRVSAQPPEACRFLLEQIDALRPREAPES